MLRGVILLALLSDSICYARVSVAGGLVTQKIYDPYVQLLEREIEYQYVNQRNDEEIGDVQQHQLALGKAFSDRWFGEVVFIGEETEAEDFTVVGYEVEAKWQLTEQGEYHSDWGLLFEVERETDNNVWENSVSLLVAHSWRRWLATANIAVVYEWGSGIDNEFESRFAGRIAYRHRPEIEPAIELFSSEAGQAIGPSLLGSYRLPGRQKLYWQVALAFGLTDSTADTNLAIRFDYEF